MPRPPLDFFKVYYELSGTINAELFLSEQLRNRTSLRIGGACELLILTHDLDALTTSVNVLDRLSCPWVILGKASNVLVSDAGFKGCVIVLGREFSRVQQLSDSPSRMLAGAGLLLSRLISAAQKHALGGLEPFVGIPGTVGGALSLGAQALSGERIFSFVHDIVVLRLQQGGRSLFRLDRSDPVLEPSDIILEATFDLVPREKSEIAQKTKDAFSVWKRTQPLGFPCSGPVFSPPVYEEDEAERRLEEECLKEERSEERRREGAHLKEELRPSVSSEPTSITTATELNGASAVAPAPGAAGASAALAQRSSQARRSLENRPPSLERMLQSCNLRGRRVGGAQIATTNPNFVCNVARARAEEVLSLMKLMHDSVEEKYGIDLAPQIRFLGFHA